MLVIIMLKKITTNDFFMLRRTDEDHLVSSGVDADVYCWDLRGPLGRCTTRFHHDDGTATTSLACNNSFLAVGSESGAVSVFGQDYCVSQSPVAVRTLMNLTTKINCMAMHPSGELMAMASAMVMMMCEARW